MRGFNATQPQAGKPYRSRVWLAWHQSPKRQLRFPHIVIGTATLGLFSWLSQMFSGGLGSGSPSDAILHCDLKLAESLRDKMTEVDVREVAEIYHNLGDWPPKDIAIHLLQDSDSEIVRSVMEDGLNSPTAEARATALCWLTSDSGETFQSFLNDGWVDPEKVDAAIAAYRNSSIVR